MAFCQKKATQLGPAGPKFSARSCDRVDEIAQNASVLRRSLLSQYQSCIVQVLNCPPAGFDTGESLNRLGHRWEQEGRFCWDMTQPTDLIQVGVAVNRFIRTASIMKRVRLLGSLDWRSGLLRYYFPSWIGTLRVGRKHCILRINRQTEARLQ